MLFLNNVELIKLPFTIAQCLLSHGDCIAYTDNVRNDPL